MGSYMDPNSNFIQKGWVYTDSRTMNAVTGKLFSFAILGS
jgi:hypothetical protein